MTDRLEREISLLQKKYTSVRHDQNYDWVVVEDLPLSEAYNRDATNVLIFIPPGYPETPPDNFFVPTGLQLTSGEGINRFSKNHTTHEDYEWDRFSWHEEEGWSPSADIQDGSNLLTFMLTVENRLEEAE